MNKRIDFSFTGGFPATQYMTDYMQTSYRSAFIALAGLIGDKVIVTGAVIMGGVVTNGWLSINGELVPFIGGPYVAGDSIVIIETTESRLFQDNATHGVYFKREARIGSPGLFLFSDLKNIGTLKDILPTGLISMWSGAIVDIPIGWALCDGTDGTPNLGKMFIVGYDAGDVDYNAIGNTGGTKTHTLTIGEMPSHDHAMPDDYGEAGSSGHVASGGSSHEGAITDRTGVAGGGAAHENRPPFYTLAYIIKL
jgi:microcystin-dependent protein